MPVCILGTGRSGTSMVARLLHDCGLYLGPESDLLDPKSGEFGVRVEQNPEGFWENVRFIHFNNDLFAMMGGDYLHLPDLQPGWERDPRLIPMRHRAKGLIAAFDQHQFWGWKDPRNTSTLAFWQSLFPDLQIVLCLRSPAEAIQSYRFHSNQALEFSFEWWKKQYDIMVTTLNNSPYIVTHYETYFYDPAAELRRLTDFLGISPSEQMIADAVNTISTSLHRQISPDILMEKEGVSLAVQQYYCAFRAEAGPVYDRMQQDSNYQNEMLRRTVLRLHDRFTQQMQQEYETQVASKLQEAKQQLHDAHRREMVEAGRRYEMLRQESEAKLAEAQNRLAEIDGLYQELYLKYHRLLKTSQHDIADLLVRTHGAAIHNRATPSGSGVVRVLRNTYRGVIPLPLRLRLRDARQTAIRKIRPVYRTIVPTTLRLGLRDIRVQLIGR